MMTGLRFWAVLGAGVVGVLALAGVDYATGAEISFSVFYLAPIAAVAWYGGRRSGIAMAVFAAVAWGLVDQAANGSYSHSLIPVWNAGVRFLFFLITVVLLSTLHSAREHERTLARTDSLTGLSNTRSFYAAVSAEFARSRRSGATMTLAYLDLDHFKSVNDTLGHAAGDELLRAIAASLRSCLREVDVVARLGGDEFAILMPETGLAGAEEALARLTDCVDAALGDVLPEVTSVGVTIGAVVLDTLPDSVDDAVAEVDALMYEGKRKGRGRVEIVVRSERQAAS